MSPNHWSGVRRGVRAMVFMCAVLLALAFALTTRAQTGWEQPTLADSGTAEIPAHIAVIDGTATVERDGQSQPAAANSPFVVGDRLRTAAGRVEILLADGSALDIDQYSLVDLQSPTLIRLESGRVLLTVRRSGNQAALVRYRIDTPVASAQTDSAGEFRVAVFDDPSGLLTELAVLRGLASLVTERGAMAVLAGERSIARDAAAPSPPEVFNSARADAFDRWAAARRDERTGSVSSEYLPPDLQVYGGTFDDYGSWQYTAPYGNVWYPAVGPGWRPYYYGHWAPYERWGWTWIGGDAWAWPTHHFGRWGFARSHWFWIPGRTWSPAWVAWAGAPGYVGWCPLGFDERPVFAFSLGFASRWGGWTVLPGSSFVTAGRADRFAVAPERIARATEFVLHRTAPVAVPRTAHAQNVTVGGAAAAIAVPRSAIVSGPPAGAVRPATASAVPRVNTSAPAPPAREFKQPLPGGTPPAYAAPRAYAVPRQQTAPSPTVAPPGAHQPPPAFVNHPYQPAPRPFNHSYEPPPARAERPAAPAVHTAPPPTAVPRSAPAPAFGNRQYEPPPGFVNHPYQAAPRPADRPYQPAPGPSNHSYEPPPARAYQPPPAHAYQPPPVRAYEPPPSRADRPAAPAVHTPPPPAAVPRSAPAPSAGPRSGGGPPPSPAQSGGSGGSSHGPHASNSGGASSGEAHRR